MEILYLKLKKEQPAPGEYFYAFNKEQFDEGVKEAGIEGKKIVSYGFGLYGTREGIDKLLSHTDTITKRIGEECDPQSVYDYEYENHECGYTGDDTEAIKLVFCYFTDEQAKKVKRRNALLSIKQIAQTY